LASTLDAVAVETLVLPNTYRDSVELMRVAAELESRPGVHRAALVIATEANREVLQAADLLTGDALSAGANDLVVAIAAEPTALAAALSEARTLLSGRPAAGRQAASQRVAPRTLHEALDEQPDTELALISTPGVYATAEALKALKAGLDVFLFSDNVSIEDEIELKTLARRKGRLLMGPDCGTAILGGLPLGFANAVRPGGIGLVGASGTGLQQVTCLIDAAGEGISQAIGVGGRDLDERVGGSMMLCALERLASDPSTKVIVLISKPPAPSVAASVLESARSCGKPVVVNFLGATLPSAVANLVFAETLESAACAAVALARGEIPGADPSGLPSDLLSAGFAQALLLTRGNRRIVGLFSGGTLCKEASHLLADTDHDLVDLGDDEFTVGRPHPMIDARLRCERIVEVGGDARVGVLLLDIVLGYGSHMDPAGALSDAIATARNRAAQDGRYLVVVASVCGTRADPQPLAEQQATLDRLGVLVAPSNAQAARLAGFVAGAGAA
jgi:succinyl-CoA synthetase alpha subunit